MLNLFRKHATSWLIKVALFLIVIVFIFWGGYTYRSKKETQMARVDDQYISIQEYNKSYDQMVELYRRQLGGSFSEDLLRQLNIKRQALDMMINRYLVTKSARELGLMATNEEVQQKILEYPVFQSDGKFDQKRYTAVLQQNRLTPEAFEEQMRVDLTAEKLEQFIKRRAVVTEEEILADFNFHFNQVQLAYVLLDPQSFEEKVVLDDKSLQAYYEEHKDRYQEPEKRQIVHVLFKADSFTEQVKVSDEEVRQYYEENQDEFHKEEEVKARHILFPVKESAPEEEVGKVRAEAQKVLDEARQGKDFAELAKKHSKDPGSAKEGGDLGFFNRERMAPAFSDAAFALKPGEISDLVRTQFGFHIIKVEEARPEKTDSLDEVRPQIEAKLKEEKSRDVAYKKAREFADLVYAQRDMEKTAGSRNLEIGGKGAWVSREDSLAGVEPTGPAIMGKLFDLADKEASGVLDVPQGFLVAQVQAIQPPRLLPFENVKDKVQGEYKTEQSAVLAREKGTELLKKAREQKSLDAAAKEMGLQAQQSEWFSRREPAKGLKLTGEPLNTVLQLGEAAPFPDSVLETGSRALVCQLLGRKAPDKNLDKERDSIRKRIEQQKQTMIWQGWLEDQRKKAQVEIYKDL